MRTWLASDRRAPSMRSSMVNKKNNKNKREFDGESRNGWLARRELLYGPRFHPPLTHLGPTRPPNVLPCWWATRIAHGGRTGGRMTDVRPTGRAIVGMPLGARARATGCHADGFAASWLPKGGRRH